MASHPTTADLDRILSLQLSVAWAGEGGCEPARLGWWKTDVIDAEGGGDLFTRLLPRTHLWASLQAAREAAILTEEALRASIADKDETRSLFHLGSDVDERLRDRLGQLKRGERPPLEVFPAMPREVFPEPPVGGFEEKTFADSLRAGGQATWVVSHGGRELRGELPSKAELLAPLLAAALVPFVKPYPLPFCRLPRG
jgi:hypothetical protein